MHMYSIRVRNISDGKIRSEWLGVTYQRHLLCIKEDLTDPSSRICRPLHLTRHLTGMQGLTSPRNVYLTESEVASKTTWTTYRGCRAHPLRTYPNEGRRCLHIDHISQLYLHRNQLTSLVIKFFFSPLKTSGASWSLRSFEKSVKNRF